MINLENGFLGVNDELLFYLGYSFDDFMKTSYYTGQPDTMLFFLDEHQIINGKTYIVGLVFRERRLYLIMLMNCDYEFSQAEEDKRKLVHDKILRELGLQTDNRFPWGCIQSEFDARSITSSINIQYI